MIAFRTGLLVFWLTDVLACIFCCGAELGGFPIKVSLSQDGSSSDRASRSQED